MIWHPTTGTIVRLNYKDKSMPFQGRYATVVAVGHGPGPKNVLVRSSARDRRGYDFVVVTRGNLTWYL